MAPASSMNLEWDVGKAPTSAGNEFFAEFRLCHYELQKSSQAGHAAQYARYGSIR